jgi:hypothetical protein
LTVQDGMQRVHTNIVEPNAQEVRIAAGITMRLHKKWKWSAHFLGSFIVDA